MLLCTGTESELTKKKECPFQQHGFTADMFTMNQLRWTVVS